MLIAAFQKWYTDNRKIVLAKGLYKLLNAILIICYVGLIFSVFKMGLASDRLLYALVWIAILGSLAYGHLKFREWASWGSFPLLFLMLVSKPIEVLPIAADKSEEFYLSYGSVLGYVAAVAIAHIILQTWLFDRINHAARTVSRINGR